MILLTWGIITTVIFVIMIITGVYHLLKPKDTSKDSVSYDLSQGTDKDTLSNKKDDN